MKRNYWCLSYSICKNFFSSPGYFSTLEHIDLWYHKPQAIWDIFVTLDNLGIWLAVEIHPKCNMWKEVFYRLVWGSVALCLLCYPQLSEGNRNEWVGITETTGQLTLSWQNFYLLKELSDKYFPRSTMQLVLKKLKIGSGIFCLQRTWCSGCL